MTTYQVETKKINMGSKNSTQTKFSNRIGLDIHGVLNNHSDLFSGLTQDLKNQGFEIHILTGPRLNFPYRTKLGNFNSVEEELEYYGIKYDYLFSVLDYNIKQGKKAWKNKDGWWTDEASWNQTKGKYSEYHQLDFHLDDTLVYRDFFTTPFGFLDNSKKIIEVSKTNINPQLEKILIKHLGSRFKFIQK